MTLRTLNYGNYGIFLIMGNAGFCPSTVVSIRLLSVYEVGFRVYLTVLVSVDRPPSEYW